MFYKGFNSAYATYTLTARWHTDAGCLVVQCASKHMCTRGLSLASSTSNVPFSTMILSMLSTRFNSCPEPSAAVSVTSTWSQFYKTVLAKILG
jgi:hypothetical protein